MRKFNPGDVVMVDPQWFGVVESQNCSTVRLVSNHRFVDYELWKPSKAEKSLIEAGEINRLQDLLPPG